MSQPTGTSTPEPAASGLDQPRQPLLHDLVVTVAAPAVVLSSPSGDIARGVEGLYVDDRRLLSRLDVRVDGDRPELLRAQSRGGGRARFVAVVRAGREGTDPTVVVDRRRDVTVFRRGGDLEVVSVRNTGTLPVTCELAVGLACDLADMAEVRRGLGGPPREPVLEDGGLRWVDPEERIDVRLTASPMPQRVTAEHDSGVLHWRVALEPGAAWSTRLRVDAHTPRDRAVVLAPTRDVLGTVTVTGADHRVSTLVEQSLHDLRGLVAADPEDPEDHVACAGAPWYLTLFGRDALWTARMLLPLGTDLAGGTLRALARRQGRSVDPVSEEAPGKILHELRGGYTSPSGDLNLPPLYFGTIDATPLFVTLLAEAWRWGLPDDEVAALVPHAERALAWMRDHGDADGDGFLEYAPSGPGGLSNQGWKDSGDSVQHADGRLAAAPIALSEVQAYAYQAAVLGAGLLDAFDRPGGDHWREWAHDLRERFRGRFWVDHADGAYPAIALDAGKRPVDGVASNMGHLLGTGLLDRDEAVLVARRLASPALSSGFGLRTLASDLGGYNPLSYHVGSVWPHDTAIAVAGLARDGFTAEAATLAAGLVAAAPAFGYRLPELYSGEPSADGWEPLPYPAACRPQAWSAAAPVAVLVSLLGVDPDVPSGLLRVARAVPTGLAPLEVRGIRVGSEVLSLGVGAGGTVTVLDAPAGLRVVQGDDAR